MKLLTVLVALGTIIAAFVVGVFFLGIIAFCSDSSAGCSPGAIFRSLFGRDWPLLGLLLLSIAFLVSGTGLLFRRQWARYLGIVAWLACAAVVIYGISSSGQHYRLIDRLYQLSLLLPSLLALAFLFSPVSRT